MFSSMVLDLAGDLFGQINVVKEDLDQAQKWSNIEISKNSHISAEGLIRILVQLVGFLC